MIPNKITIPQLFQVHCRHLVPIFQRRYVWDQSKQWEPLWEDIRRKATEVLLGVGQAANAPPRRHFLGAVVVKGLPVMGLEYPAIEVIDGQQRLTTLQIVLVALRDYVRSVEFKKVEPMLVTLTENPPLSGAQHEFFKVLPTMEDRPGFEMIWKAGSADGLRRLSPPTRQKYARQDDPLPKLIRAYLYFFEEIATFARAPDESGDSAPPSQAEVHGRLEALVVAITQRIELVRIDLEQDDDPQVIFETLNARGEPLLPSDLVRNFLFLEASRRPQTAARVAELHQKHWARFGTPFWTDKVTQGRYSIPRIDLFLFHFLASFIDDPRDEVQVGHLSRRGWSPSTPAPSIRCCFSCSLSARPKPRPSATAFLSTWSRILSGARCAA